MHRKQSLQTGTILKDISNDKLYLVVQRTLPQSADTTLVSWYEEVYGDYFFPILIKQFVICIELNTFHVIAVNVIPDNIIIYDKQLTKEELNAYALKLKLCGIVLEDYTYYLSNPFDISTLKDGESFCINSKCLLSIFQKYYKELLPDGIYSINNLYLYITKSRDDYYFHTLTNDGYVLKTLKLDKNKTDTDLYEKLKLLVKYKYLEGVKEPFLYKSLSYKIVITNNAKKWFKRFWNIYTNYLDACMNGTASLNEQYLFYSLKSCSKENIKQAIDTSVLEILRHMLPAYIIVKRKDAMPLKGTLPKKEREELSNCLIQEIEERIGKIDKRQSLKKYLKEKKITPGIKVAVRENLYCAEQVCNGISIIKKSYSYNSLNELIDDCYSDLIQEQLDTFFDLFMRRLYENQGNKSGYAC